MKWEKGAGDRIFARGCNAIFDSWINDESPFFSAGIERWREREVGEGRFIADCEGGKGEKEREGIINGRKILIEFYMWWINCRCAVREADGYKLSFLLLYPYPYRTTIKMLVLNFSTSKYFLIYFHKAHWYGFFVALYTVCLCFIQRSARNSERISCGGNTRPRLNWPNFIVNNSRLPLTIITIRKTKSISDAGCRAHSPTRT